MKENNKYYQFIKILYIADYYIFYKSRVYTYNKILLIKPVISHIEICRIGRRWYN